MPGARLWALTDLSLPGLSGLEEGARQQVAKAFWDAPQCFLDGFSAKLRKRLPNQHQRALTGPLLDSAAGAIARVQTSAAHASSQAHCLPLPNIDGDVPDRGASQGLSGVGRRSGRPGCCGLQREKEANRRRAPEANAPQA